MHFLNFLTCTKRWNFHNSNGKLQLAMAYSRLIILINNHRYIFTYFSLPLLHTKWKHKTCFLPYILIFFKKSHIFKKFISPLCPFVSFWIKLMFLNARTVGRSENLDGRVWIWYLVAIIRIYLPGLNRVNWSISPLTPPPHGFYGPACKIWAEFIELWLEFRVSFVPILQL